MKKGPNITDDPKALRISAERQLAASSLSTSISGDEKKLLHELQVHQIELELLNENLRIAQAELEKSRACYHDLYEWAPVGYLTVNDRDIIQNVNLTAANMLGFTRKALINMPLSRFILAEDQDQYYLQRKQLGEPGVQQSCELHFVKQNGQIFWVRMEMNRMLEANGEPGFRVVLIDISDIKQIESELRETDERLELALAASGLVIWDWNIPEGKVTTGNRWFELLGYTDEQLGKGEEDWMKLINPKDLGRLEQNISAHLQGETAGYEDEHQLRHKEGHWVSVEVKGKVTRRDKDNNPLRMVGTILDITQRKRLNEEGMDLLKRIESLIRQSTSRSTGKTETEKPAESLTKRQRQILGMIAMGMTSAEIGRQLHLSTSTVISHRRNLMANLNLHSAADITRFAIEHGLLSSK